MITAVGQVGLGPGEHSVEQHRVHLRVSSEHQRKCGVSMASSIMDQSSRLHGRNPEGV